MLASVLRKCLYLILGTFQIHHRYHLTFEAPKNLLPESEDVTVDLPDPPNPNCRLLKLEDSQESDSHASLTVELVAHKEKLQKETVSLVDGADRSRRASFVLQARVLGESLFCVFLLEPTKYHACSRPRQGDPNVEGRGSDGGGASKPGRVGHRIGLEGILIKGKKVILLTHSGGKSHLHPNWIQCWSSAKKKAVSSLFSPLPRLLSSSLVTQR